MNYGREARIGVRRGNEPIASRISRAAWRDRVFVLEIIVIRQTETVCSIDLILRRNRDILRSRGRIAVTKDLTASPFDV